MNQTNETLSSTNSNLENGEFETELTDEEFNVKINFFYIYILN
jgi:hypothetical protein